MQRFANPTVFRRLSSAILPWAGVATIGLFAVGLWLALITSPRDYQQSDTVRIMYVHVPAAWMAMFVYANLALASGIALVWRHPLAEIAARQMAPIGACFTALCLVTGSLWGKPMWGTWWVWDARLTSVLILFFFYLGYIALANAFDEETRGTRAAAILALVGVINLPIIKFSVEWWNTLHQPASVAKLGGPSIHPSMLAPLLVMAAAFTAYFVTVLLWRMDTALAERRLATKRLLAESATTMTRARA